MKRSLCLAVALLALLPVAASADRAQTFIGSTSVGGTYQRAVADGSGISGQPGPMRFIAQEFKVTGNSTCSVFSSQEFDGVIFIYRNTFNPANPLANYLAGNDDGPVGVGPAPADDVESVGVGFQACYVVAGNDEFEVPREREPVEHVFGHAAVVVCPDRHREPLIA